MLFDMRSPGRRMAVKVIYSTLAILLGGGLVLFGIGSGVSGGGLFDALSSDAGSLSDDAFFKEAERKQQFVKTHPNDAVAYAQLARLRFQAAAFDDSKGTFTTEGILQLRHADRAWTRHLELAKDKPDVKVANVMLRVYDSNALNELDKAADAMQLIIDDAGSAATARQYAQLSYFAYLGQNARLGELAGDKAIDLSPADDREQIKALIDSYKQAGTEVAAEAVPGGDGQ